MLSGFFSLRKDPSHGFQSFHNNRQVVIHILAVTNQLLFWGQRDKTGVKALLCTCFVSVQMPGTTYGLIPEYRARSKLRVQLDVAPNEQKLMCFGQGESLKVFARSRSPGFDSQHCMVPEAPLDVPPPHRKNYSGK